MMRETASCVGDHGEGVQHLPRRSGQAIEPGHHQHVASGELVERAAKLAALGLGSARSLALRGSSARGQLPASCQQPRHKHS
jgi:hypothetical protein